MSSQPILALIDAASAGTVFVAELKSLPYRAKNYEVQNELKKCNAAYETIDFKRDQEDKLIKVKLTIKNKEDAKAILGLNKSTFLRRKLIVEFPDLLIDEDDLPEPAIIPVPSVNPAPTPEPSNIIKPVPEPEKVAEIIVKNAIVPEPEKEIKKNVEHVLEDKPAVNSQPKEENKKKPKAKEDSKPPADIPQGTKSVWELDAATQIDIIMNSKAPIAKQKPQTSAGKKESKKPEKGKQNRGRANKSHK